MLLNCGVGEDSWESLCSHLLADCKKIKPVNPKGNHSWIFIGRTDVEAETPVLWPHDAKNWLIGKDPDAGKDWRQEEKGTKEDETIWWHHRLNGHEFEQALGVGEVHGVAKNRTQLSDWTGWYKVYDTADPLIHYSVNLTNPLWGIWLSFTFEETEAQEVSWEE